MQSAHNLTPSALDVQKSRNNGYSAKQFTAIDMIVLQTKFEQKEKNYQKAIQKIQQDNFNLKLENQSLQQKLKNLMPKIEETIEMQQKFNQINFQLETSKTLINDQKTHISNLASNQQQSFTTKIILEQIKYFIENILIPGLIPGQILQKIESASWKIQHLEQVFTEKINKIVANQRQNQVVSSGKFSEKSTFQPMKNTFAEASFYVPYQPISMDDLGVMKNSCYGE